MHACARFRFVALGLLALAALLTLPAAAAADGTYRTERLALAPVADAPLRSGFVVNAHANGPRVYANERYVLTGALPNETYLVTLLVFPGDPTCAGAPALAIETATLTTNAAGNGEARARFTPADVGPVQGMTIGGLWQVSLDGAVQYATACTAIALD